ncbi:helix-turn-helix transcriptional regulator [Neptunicella sp. SCSIO 80796]|uniref:helix-turn-helix transcriptional regulator n=1 Tax=Neptunicella plasticusilytica TaxID=3117012 RepID=UPI003A4D7D45
MKQSRVWQNILELGPECHERFLVQDNVSLLASLEIGFAGISSLRGRYQVGRRNPDYHTLLFTIEGRGKLHSPAGEQTIEANTMTVLPVAQPFLFELDAELWKTAWFCLDNGQLWEHLRANRASIQYCESAQAIYHLLCHLYYENRPDMQSSSITQIQQYLQQSIGKNILAQNEFPAPMRRLEKLFQHIQQQLHFPWTIDEMAAYIHYSPPHLHRLCQKIYQQSPLQRLIQLRMERAQHLLTETNWSLAQIANTVGYQDVFNFSNRFKKSVGLAPIRYRNQHSLKPN